MESLKDKMSRYAPPKGDLPRVELFARQKTEGWDVWGNEVEGDIDLSQLKDGK